MLAVAPNGARKTQQDHPLLPITPKELAATAATCNDAGAVLIHLHVRDKNLTHTLDPFFYQPAIKAVRDAVGDRMIIQITTEAVGKYQPQEQIDCVKALKPEAVSISIRELLPQPNMEKQASKFFEWMFKERVSPQFILYSKDDIEYFLSLQRRGIILSDSPNVLLVLGRYTANQESDCKELEPLVALLPASLHWWLCAFGKSELECMKAAMKSAGHCRVGFENNLFDSTGKHAESNSSQVAAVAEHARSQSRGLATVEQAKLLMDVR